MPQDYHLRERLGYRLSRASRMMQERLESRLAEHDMTRMKWCILSGVGIEGHRAPSDLADNIGVTRPVISRLLKVMAKDGLIARRLADGDGRGREIIVLELGLEKLRVCRDIVENNQQHFLAKLGDDQARQLYEALDALSSGEDDLLENL